MSARRSFTRAWLPAAALLLVVACPVPGRWSAPRTLQPTFGVSSPPVPAAISAGPAGHTVAAWDATGLVRYADRPAGGPWSLSRPVFPGAIGGFVTVAVGGDGSAVVAWIVFATELTPAYVTASVRSGTGPFEPPVHVAIGTSVYELATAVGGDGTATLAWAAPAGILAASHPAGGGWTTPVVISDPAVGGRGPAVVANAAGDVLAAWQQGNPNAIGTAYRAAGEAWQAPVPILSGSGAPTWTPSPGLDGSGHAVVGYVEGSTLLVTTRKPGAVAWDVPIVVSPTAHAVQTADVAIDAAGNALAAWRAPDALGLGAVYRRERPATADWGTVARVSGLGEDAAWPALAFSDDGTVAAVTWIDDITSEARAAVGAIGATWTSSTLGPGWWDSVVPVAAGGGTVAATWATVVGGNPNQASLIARTFE